jgi:integrase
MLTEVAIKRAIREATIANARKKLFDSGGLYLLIDPPKSLGWRYKYRIGGREKLLSFGIYPDVPTSLARERRDEARKQLAVGRDPSQVRKAVEDAQANTFISVARELLKAQAAKLDPGTLAQKTSWLEKRVFPHIGRLPIAEIPAPQILALLRKIEATGRHETARRVKTAIGEVMRYAVACGLTIYDPTTSLRGALIAGTKKSFAAVTDPERLSQILRIVWTYSGQPATEVALKYAFYVFPRPGELRKAEWSEFDLDAALWRLPPEKMKARKPHTVPLSRQAVALLEELQPLTGGGKFVFTSPRSAEKPLSENTLVGALRRLGIDKGEQTAHGVRAAASTLLNEQDWSPDLIELQLAHAPKDRIRAAYNRGLRIEERRKMMQHWADYLDGLRLRRNTPTATPSK